MSSNRAIQELADVRAEQIREFKNQIAEAQRREKDIQWSRAYRLGLLISEMQDAIKTLPKDKRVDAMLADCNFRRLTPGRHRPGIIRLAGLQDGAAVLFTTKGALADYAHTLTMPKEGETELYTTSINVDSQCIPRSNSSLSGYEEIAKDALARNSLHYCAGALAVEAETGWQHAITEPATLGIRAQV